MPPSTRVYTVEQYSFACIGESANVTRCRRIRFFRRVSGATIANGDIVDKIAIRCRNAQGKSGGVFQKFMGTLCAGRHCSAGAAGSAVRTVVTQQKANCRAE